MSSNIYNFRPFEIIEENYLETFIPGARSGRVQIIKIKYFIRKLLKKLYFRTPNLL